MACYISFVPLVSSPGDPSCEASDQQHVRVSGYFRKHGYFHRTTSPVNQDDAMYVDNHLMFFCFDGLAFEKLGLMLSFHRTTGMSINSQHTQHLRQLIYCTP
jgi:hypothetical protein